MISEKLVTSREYYDKKNIKIQREIGKQNARNFRVNLRFFYLFVLGLIVIGKTLNFYNIYIIVHTVSLRYEYM